MLAFTIARVAAMLGEDEDWLSDVAREKMDPEAGCLTVMASATGHDRITSFEIENLRNSSRSIRPIQL